MVTFTTIVPGSSQGRYPHMHFEIYPELAQATDYSNRILTSQLAIPATACNAVYRTIRIIAPAWQNFQNRRWNAT